MDSLGMFFPPPFFFFFFFVACITPTEQAGPEVPKCMTLTWFSFSVPFSFSFFLFGYSVS